MKIVDLKCPSCSGKLVPMKDNPKIVTCEYCGSQFLLEEDKIINYHIHQYGENMNHMAGGPQQGTWSSSGRPQQGAWSSPGRPQQGAQSSSGGSRSAMVMAATILIVIMTIGIGFSTMLKKEDKKSVPSVPSVSSTDVGYKVVEEKEETGLGEPSPMYESIVEAIFSKSAASVSEDDLKKVTYLSLQKSSDSMTVKYSLDGFYGDTEAQIFSVELPALDWQSEDLARFQGLEKLDIPNLEPADLAQIVPDATRILDLEFKNIDSLEGVSAFSNLESLSVDGILAPDLKQLVSLKNLKSLSIVEDEPSSFGTSDSQENSLTDYSAISVLSGLEELSLESPYIRDFSFLKTLPELTSLTIVGTDAINMEPLAGLSKLTALTLADNSQLINYGPLESMTGLISLTIDKSTAQDDPDLSALKQLKELDMCGFISISFLKNLTGIEKLSLHGCNIDEISAISSLTGLKDLSLYSVWTYAVPLKDLSFLNGMTQLERADFCGVASSSSFGGYGHKLEVYGDISNVFNHEGLKELYLNNCMFSIDFEKLKENPSLTKLQMKEVSLKENMYVRTSNGMTDVWYDDVVFDEHTDFLTNYPNLEELYLSGNQLTNIQFAASLKQLTALGLYDNYVTELSPLNQAENLRFLDVRKNPISGTIEDNGKIEILK